MKRNIAEYSITKKDSIYILLIVLVYGVISFVRLGSLHNPNTFWTAKEAGEKAIIKLENPSELNKVRVYRGYSEGTGILAGSLDGKQFEKIKEIEGKEVFAWSDSKVQKPYAYIGFFADEPQYSIGEVMFYDQEGNRIKASPEDEAAKKLLDEPKEVPEEISTVNTSYFDEIYFARTAYEYVHELPEFEWTHPPLGKLIQSLPIYLFGMNPFAYRLMGNIAGILMLIVMYIFSKKLTGSTAYAALGAALLAADGMHFVQTRIGTVDSFLVLFTLTAYLGMYIYMQKDNSTSFWNKALWLLLSGTFMGLAIAVKWTGTYAALGLAIIFFINFFRREKKLGKEEWKKQRLSIILWCIVCFGLIPISIYLLSYIPFMSHYMPGQRLKAFFELQKDMLSYHEELTVPHDYASKWYGWPFGYKLIWYYKGFVKNGKYDVLFLTGNPITWWPAVGAALYSIYRAWKKKEEAFIFISIAILTAYVPYIFIRRPMFLYHYFPVLPLILLNLTLILKEIAEKAKKLTGLRIYIALALGSFLVYYPIYAGIKIPNVWAQMAVWIVSAGVY